MVKPLVADDEVASVTSTSTVEQSVSDAGTVVVDSIGKLSDITTNGDTGVSDSADTVDENAAEAAVNNAEALANKVDAAAERIIKEVGISDAWGLINPKRAVISYIAARAVTEGLEQVSIELNIDPAILKEVGSVIKALGFVVNDVKDLAGNIPAEVWLAAAFYYIKNFGNDTNLVASFLRENAGTSQQFQDYEKRWRNAKGWARVGKVTGRRFGPNIGHAIARGGPYAFLAYVVYRLRHEIYGGVKGVADGLKSRAQKEDRGQLESDIYDAGDPNNPTPLTIDPKTGQVTVSRNYGGLIPMVTRNKGGLIAY